MRRMRINLWVYMDIVLDMAAEIRIVERLTVDAMRLKPLAQGPITRPYPPYPSLRAYAAPSAF